MSDDIDVLGSSLLNRQRVTRKRTEKRLKRDTRNQALLNIGATGVRIANKYLQDRARNFVDNNEELAGQRMLYNKALRNKERLLGEYDLAQANPEGVEDWLAQNKFAPIIRRSLEKQYDTTGYKSGDITNYIYDQALIKAKEYKGDWQNAVDEAFKLGTIDDYDAYIASNDGRAENVGGFLFNKISRSLNNKTQEDVNNEVIASIKNNRFADDAAQAAKFDNALQAGYSASRSTRLAKTLEDLNIRKEPREMVNLRSVAKTYTEFGQAISVEVEEATYKDPITGELSIEFRPIKDAKGNPINPERFNIWANSPEGSREISSNNPDRQPLSTDYPTAPNITNEILNEMFIKGEAAYDPDTTNQKRQRITDPVTGRTGTRITTNILSKSRDMQIPAILGSSTLIDWDYDQTFETQFAGLDDDLAREGANVFKDALVETDNWRDMMEAYAYGDRNKYEEAEDERAAVNARFEAIYESKGRELYIKAKDLSDKYTGLDMETAKDLVASAMVNPIVLAYDEETEAFTKDENYLELEGNTFATALLLGDDRLDQIRGVDMGGVRGWDGLDQSMYQTLVKDALGEIGIQAGTNPIDARNIKATSMAEKLLALPNVRNTVIPADQLVNADGTPSELVDKLFSSGRPPTGDRPSFTGGDILNYYLKEATFDSSGETPQPPQPKVIDQTIDSLSRLRMSMDFNSPEYKEISSLLNEMTEARDEKILNVTGEFIYNTLNTIDNFYKDYLATRTSPEETWNNIKKLKEEEDSLK